MIARYDWPLLAGFCLLRLCCPLAKSDARGGQYQCN